MHMTMLNTLPARHPIYLLLAPQSKYVMAFDDVLIELWSAIAPPTSLATCDDFHALANGYAAGRSYFDDDPKTTIQQLGLRRRDFTATSLGQVSGCPAPSDDCGTSSRATSILS